MANINDYLDWRNDIPFSVDPFNEVDNLILSELVYSPFDGIVPGPGQREKITIDEVCKKFFETYTEEELLAKNTITKVAPFLLKKMAGSPRYKGLKLAGYVSEHDATSDTQFAVVSFYLPDGTIYVAYRGTDDTLIGWKEDFDMCYSQGTGGQLKAVNYLNDNFSRTMKRIRVGGHSKGGNFAVYASAFCKNSVKDNIIEIYSNDGPGFIPEIINSDEYQSIVKKVHSFIPKQSIIGLLMNNNFKSKIVESDAKGINQHDPMSWMVTKNSFDESFELDESSIIIDEAIKTWANGFDYETRNLFGEIVFSALEASGATKLSEVKGDKLKSLAALKTSYDKLDKEQQAMVSEILSKLLNVSSSSVKSSVLGKMPKKPKIVRKKE